MSLQLVLVTGASGYLGASIVLSFLAAGFHVRAAVRTQEQADLFLAEYSKYGDLLEFVIVPVITVDHVFDEAVKGVDYVVHTASPVPDMSKPVSHKELLDPAIQGTTSILDSALLEPKIQAFVLTSSVAAVRDFKKPPVKGQVLDASIWNSLTYEEALELPATAVMAVYSASKSLAEKAAWDFVAQHKPGFTLTTILPTWVMGRSQEAGLKKISDLRSSAGMTATIVVDGALPSSPAFYKYVAIQDVVRAHVEAILRPETSGKRYLLTAGNASAEKVAFLLRKNFPEQAHRIPEVEDGPIPDPYGLDGRPAETAFDFVYQTLEETVVDFGKQLFELSPAVGR